MRYLRIQGFIVSFDPWQNNSSAFGLEFFSKFLVTRYTFWNSFMENYKPSKALLVWRIVEGCCHKKKEDTIHAMLSFFSISIIQLSPAISTRTIVGSNKPQMTNLIGHENAAVHLPEARDQVAIILQEMVCIHNMEEPIWIIPFLLLLALFVTLLPLTQPRSFDFLLNSWIAKAGIARSEVQKGTGH